MQSSARFYPNRFARLLLLAMEQELGSYSTQALLKAANLPAVFPDDSLERQYPFAQLAALNRALFMTYGQQGGHALALSIGQSWFSGMARIGAFAGFADPAYQHLPLNVRVSVGLKVVAEVFNRLSDQTNEVTTVANLHYVLVSPSPFVYPNAEHPTCGLFGGLLMGSLQTATGGKRYTVRETECEALGAKACKFTVSKQPIG